MKTFFFVTIAAVLLLFGCGCSGSTTKEQNDSLKDVAHDAFIYAYPMMEQVKTINCMQK